MGGMDEWMERGKWTSLPSLAALANSRTTRSLTHSRTRTHAHASHAPHVTPTPPPHVPYPPRLPRPPRPTTSTTTTATNTRTHTHARTHAQIKGQSYGATARCFSSSLVPLADVYNLDLTFTRNGLCYVSNCYSREYLQVRRRRRRALFSLLSQGGRGGSSRGVPRMRLLRE